MLIVKNTNNAIELIAQEMLNIEHKKRHWVGGQLVDIPEDIVYNLCDDNIKYTINSNKGTLVLFDRSVNVILDITNMIHKLENSMIENNVGITPTININTSKYTVSRHIKRYNKERKFVIGNLPKNITSRYNFIWFVICLGNYPFTTTDVNQFINTRFNTIIYDKYDVINTLSRPRNLKLNHIRYYQNIITNTCRRCVNNNLYIDSNVLSFNPQRAFDFIFAGISNKPISYKTTQLVQSNDDICNSCGCQMFGCNYADYDNKSYCRVCNVNCGKYFINHRTLKDAYNYHKSRNICSSDCVNMRILEEYDDNQKYHHLNVSTGYFITKSYICTNHPLDVLTLLFEIHSELCDKKIYKIK